MIRAFKIYALAVLALLFNSSLQAQEKVVPFRANLQLMSAQQSTTKAPLASKTATVAALDTIPFFEDFSYSPNSPYPSVKHWVDSNVFINHTLPLNPPSIGVATFDGLNKNGYPYNLAAAAASSNPADKLTSRPINLQIKGSYVYSPADSVYLSFYYQARGRSSNYPEAKDSLALDFYKPNQRKWQTVWAIKGYDPAASDSLFHLVMMPIKDTAYFDSLFQFRFRNKATLSGNNDFWHIDYIYMDKNRSRIDTVIQDLTFTYMASPFLKNYYAMPYRQFMASEIAPKFSNYPRNNYTSGQNIFYNYELYDKNNVLLNTYSGGNNNQPSSYGNTPNTWAPHVNPPITYAFPAPLIDSTTYTVVHRLGASTGTLSSDYYRKNDTLIQKFSLSTYYAYDDGTAENGYYLNAFGAKKALRYTLNVADTLRALRIYFDPIIDNPAIINSSFRLMVWADGGNKPGNVIYRDSAVYPKYLQGSYNLIPTYKLTSCLLLTPGTYYFGIQQTSNQALNIGLDMNNNHGDALYYDIGSGWVQSAIKGSLMINPMLGCNYPPTPVGLEEYADSRKAGHIQLYPNPAQNTVRIHTNGIVIDKGTVRILSLVGQIAYSETYSSGDEIDISSLPNGIYFLQLDATEISTTPQKLIISR